MHPLTAQPMSPPKNERINQAIFGVVCILVMGFLIWGAEPGLSVLKSPRAEDCYYNLLVQGFREGQLNVKKEAPSELAHLANPYDHTANAEYISDVEDLSYYKGKLYLYFGVTPALVLFWPYVMLTGHYLPDAYAGLVFCSIGFLIAAGLIYSIWRRYFSEANFCIAVAGIFTFGLVLAVHEIQWLYSRVYEVALSSGFAFMMLALAGIWQALHNPKRRVLWLILASFSYGLAVGSRTSLFYGSVILLAPVFQAYRTPVESPYRWQMSFFLIAALGPIALIGFGLLCYNYMRFGNPLEFGYHYQLSILHQSSLPLFSLDYLWLNLRYYFLEPLSLSSHFPYLQSVQLYPSLFGRFGPEQRYYGGVILAGYPLMWLALCAPLAWKARSEEEVNVLRCFVAALFFLFLSCGLTLCLFLFARNRYELDFLSPLMLLAIIGIFGLERSLTGPQRWRRIGRWGWRLLLPYTVAVNILAGFDADAEANYLMGNSLLYQGQLDEATSHFQRAIAFEPQCVSYHAGLGVAYSQAGQMENAIQELQRSLELQPNFGEAQYDLGYCFLQTGESDKALALIKKALINEPDFGKNHVIDENNLAWVLATDPDPKKRNGAFAVTLADNACKGTHYQKTVMLGTLAAAYAEAGRFDNAIATAQKAITLAQQNRETELLERNKQLLQIYLAHKAYHESKSTEPTN